MDSLGNVIDKLVTVDMKMWHNQELIYEIRRMTFDEYKKKYFDILNKNFFLKNLRYFTEVGEKKKKIIKIKKY